jgi:hypothetical protein
MSSVPAYRQLIEAFEQDREAFDANVVEPVKVQPVQAPPLQVHP